MKNKDLVFDRKCHVLYSSKCEKIIKKKIKEHYSKECVEQIWNKVQLKYVDYLKDFRTDLGGRKNFHNRTGGTYDCIALCCYYVVCKEFSNVKEIEEMNEDLLLPSFKKLKFLDCNKLFFKKLMYKSFLFSKKNCDKWGDYKMSVSSFDKNEPIYYEFTFCPIAEFAKKNNLLDLMPSFCNADYKAMELIKARLVRYSTCSNGCKCDFSIYGDKDSRLKQHKEYIDEKGYIRNK